MIAQAKSNSLEALKSLRNRYEDIAGQYEKLYALTAQQDKRSLAYAEMLRAVIVELDELILVQKTSNGQ